VTSAGWRRDGRRLVRDLGFRDFEQAFGFVQRLADTAVDHERRPDMCIYAFNRVRISIANQHGGPLTLADTRLASKVEDVIARSPGR
jgi:pterin-4a-carbinolamine dehydratase